MAATEKIDLCHSTESETWVQITVNVNGLNGHDGHTDDIWPPVPGVSEGMNWDADGFEVWANGCALVTEPTPIPTEPVPTPTVSTGPTSFPTPLPSLPVPTLPSSSPVPVPVVPTDGTLAYSGFEVGWLFLAAALLTMVGAWLMWLTRPGSSRRTR